MSANVVVFTKRIEFKTLLEIECKGLTGFAPVVKDSIEELRAFLGLMPQIEVLVIDNSIARKDYSFLEDPQIKNILMLTDAPLEIERCKSFASNAIEPLITYMKNLLSKDTQVQEGYISIPIDSLVHFKILPFDLFVKIGEGKFIKRVHSNEDIDEQVLNGLKAKGVAELHFERKHNRDFSMMLLNNMINKVEDDYSTPEAQLKATNEVFLTTKEIVQSVGLPPRVIQVCESVMERITSDVTINKDKFSTYLADMKTKSTLNFQFRFVELTSFIATQMIEASDEKNKDEDIKTVVFASFFCDISLKDAGQLEYRTGASLRDVWHEDQKIILEHAFKSSEIVAKYKNAPAQAETIVRQHHGSLTGKGFPAVIALELVPLAKCLMAAQELSFAILKNPETPSKDIIKNILKQFSGTPLESYIELFEGSCV